MYNFIAAQNGEVLYEFTHSNKLNFDVSWCPRNPGLVVGTSIDSATVYSLYSGEDHVAEHTTDQILDSFPGMDPFTQPQRTVQKTQPSLPKIAPKWMKRRFGASFGVSIIRLIKNSKYYRLHFFF